MKYDVRIGIYTSVCRFRLSQFLSQTKPATAIRIQVMLFEHCHENRGVQFSLIAIISNDIVCKFIYHIVGSKQCQSTLCASMGHNHILPIYGADVVAYFYYAPEWMAFFN